MLIICLRNITFIIIIIIIIIAVITIRLDKENTLIIIILAAYESCVPHDGRVTYWRVGRRRGGDGSAPCKCSVGDSVEKMPS